MRNNGAAGEDTIVAELIKYGGEGVRDAVHELIKLMWTTKYAPGMEYRNNMPDIQERDKLECNNYRGITLLNNAYKIFSSILNEILKITTEKIIGEYQCGFCRNKSTNDQLLTLRQMTEKHNEHDLDLHILFIDFKRPLIV